MFVPSQQGGGSVFWSGIESEGRYGLDSSGCYYFSGAAALSYISGDSVDMAYYLKCLGYNVDITNPKSFSVYPQINSVGQDGHTNLFIDDNFVYNNQLDVILSNSTGKTVTQKVYGNECWSAGWEYPTDINNVCYIVRQQNGGAGPIDTSGRGHWVCIFPIGDNKYQVINHNSNGPEIITHEQLTALNTAQFELHWE